jgi:type IV pilus assembly protein PilA
MLMTEKRKAGTVWVNDCRATSFTSPFGGYKESGVGRESGIEAGQRPTEGFVMRKRQPVAWIGTRLRKMPRRPTWLATHMNQPQESSMPSLRGFTLIELMVVVAILAILALMAVPIYRDKYIREQVVEAMRLTDIAKGPIATAWATTRTLPEDNAATGLPAPEKVVSNYVKSLTVEGGAIHVVFGNQAYAALSGKTLSLRPAVVEDAPVVPVAWVCGFAAVPGQMAVSAPNKTNVPKVWLPVNCR